MFLSSPPFSNSQNYEHKHLVVNQNVYHHHILFLLNILHHSHILNTFYNFLDVEKVEHLCDYKMVQHIQEFFLQVQMHNWMANKCINMLPTINSNKNLETENIHVCESSIRCIKEVCYRFKLVTFHFLYFLFNSFLFYLLFCVVN